MLTNIINNSYLSISNLYNYSCRFLNYVINWVVATWNKTTKKTDDLAQQYIHALPQERSDLDQQPIHALPQERSDLDQQPIHALPQERSDLDQQPIHALPQQLNYYKRNEAAKKIQNIWRIHYYKNKLSTAKQKHILSSDYFIKIKPYIDDETKINNKDFYTSKLGNTEVSLYHQEPIVIKKSNENSYRRFVNMRLARDFCEDNGLRNLIIPKAKIYKDTLLEEQLPIFKGDRVTTIKNQIGTYIENSNLFTSTAKQFTRFLIKTNINDLVSNCTPNLATSFLKNYSEFPRYDNAFLYIEEGQGKMGLIDLHTSSFKVCEHYDDKQVAKIALIFFPYHLNEILDTIKNFHPNFQDKTIIETREKLESLRDRVLKTFDLMYTNHVSFLKKNFISLKEPSKMFEASDDIKNVIVNNLLCSSIKELENKEQQSIREKYLKILNMVIKYLSKTLEEKQHGKIIASDKDLVVYRTLIIPESENFLDQISSEFPELLPENERNSLIGKLIEENHFSGKNFRELNKKVELHEQCIKLADKSIYGILEYIFNLLKKENLLAEVFCYRRYKDSSPQFMLFC